MTTLIQAIRDLYALMRDWSEEDIRQDYLDAYGEDEGVRVYRLEGGAL